MSITTIEAPGLKVFRRGKVRDTFDLGDGTLLMVATDRISAFDVILPSPIPEKGRVLTQMSRWWFNKTAHIVPNHLLPDDPDSLPVGVDWEALGPRSMRVVKAERIDIECVVRDYLAGSGWKEYRDSGTLAGVDLPSGMQESSRLPQSQFTPAIKNDDGHDENISTAKLAEIVGIDLASRLELVSLDLFAYAAEQCRSQGMILVDTKFEFGLHEGNLILIDEIFTPDSSRYWEASEWAEGRSMPSFDKQPVRDWLETQTWDKKPPAPMLPQDVIDGTCDRYIEAARRVCGLELKAAT
jgi:phosphoribosylaminoimidazole-succinocarboxamide synthase